MSPPVQQRRLKWSDFNERTAVPNPTAPAALLGFFEVRFARKVPGGLVGQEAQFAASTQVTRGALLLFVTDPTARLTPPTPPATPSPPSDRACRSPR